MPTTPDEHISLIQEPNQQLAWGEKGFCIGSFMGLPGTFLTINPERNDDLTPLEMLLPIFPPLIGGILGAIMGVLLSKRYQPWNYVENSEVIDNQLSNPITDTSNTSPTINL